MNNEYVANIVNEEGNLSGVNIVNAVVYQRNKNPAYILYIWFGINYNILHKNNIIIVYQHRHSLHSLVSIVPILWLSEEFSWADFRDLKDSNLGSNNRLV